jgi:hypothetical protein
MRLTVIIGRPMPSPAVVPLADIVQAPQNAGLPG